MLRVHLEKGATLRCCGELRVSLLCNLVLELWLLHNYYFLGGRGLRGGWFGHL